MTFSDGRWQGSWIWAARTAHLAGTQRHQHELDPEYFDRRVLLRRTFTLASVPAQAPYRITADSRYLLTINGVELGRGPIRHGYRQLFHDVGDAAHALREGENVIGIRARFFGRRNAWWVPAPTTEELGGGSAVFELKAGDDWIVTDDSWRALEPTAWTSSLPVNVVAAQIAEIFDARELDPGWDSPGFDDAGWPLARVLGDRGFAGGYTSRPPSEPYGAMRPSPLLPLACETIPAAVITHAATGAVSGEPAPGGVDLGDRVGAALAASGLAAPDPAVVPAQGTTAQLPLTVTAPAALIVDYGRVVAGHPRLSLDAAGDVVIAGAFHEVAEPDKLAHAATFRYTPRAGANDYTREDPCGGRFLVLHVMGTGTVRFDAVELVERLRPRPAGASFTASDPALTRIYEVGLRTVDLNAQDAYLDCPSREQRAWTGDSVVHQSVDLVANPDWRLAVWNPQLLDQQRGDGLLPMIGVGDFAMPDQVAIPDWALHWIRSVHNLYRYTGDRDLVASLLPSAEATLRWFLPFRAADDLLTDVTGWVLIDWAPVPVSGKSASLNALWGRGLRDFAEMADWLGDTGRATWASAQLDRLRSAYDAFWDESRGAYREHIVDGELKPVVTEHAASAAVCAGLVPDDRLDRVRAMLLDRGRTFSEATFLSGAHPDEPRRDGDEWVVAAEPFYRYVVHDAVAELGAADRMVDLVRDWSALLGTGPTAWREVWEGGSYAHGWCATPSRDLVVYTLGIAPAEPGYAVVQVAPALGGLEWAEASVPTPHGLVHVRVEKSGALHVDSPMPVEVIARDGSRSRHDAGTVHATV